MKSYKNHLGESSFIKMKFYFYVLKIPDYYEFQIVKKLGEGGTVQKEFLSEVNAEVSGRVNNALIFCCNYIWILYELHNKI